MLFDIDKQKWDPEILGYFNIEPSLLPEVVDSAYDFGIADPEWFGAPIPITGVAGAWKCICQGTGWPATAQSGMAITAQPASPPIRAAATARDGARHTDVATGISNKCLAPDQTLEATISAPSCGREYRTCS